VEKGAVLISGAAGGIGRATVAGFLEAGYEVVGIDVVPAVTELAAERYTGAVADVEDAPTLHKVVESTLRERPLRHVVPLAGRVVDAERWTLEQEPLEAVHGFSRSLSLNLTGQFALVAVALPHLRQAEGDRSITLCSSINALRGLGAPGYSAAKAGLSGLMHALAPPLGRAGIRVNAVAPGTTRTPLVEEEIRRAGDLDALERAAEQIPLGRVGEPEDVAAVIVSLADRMTFVTDQVLSVDGGQLRSFDSQGSRRRWRLRRHNRPLR
jgi:NAD(P)-dependent dehydrogenase (short-subunit alcohol dehydrogenase family)